MDKDTLFRKKRLINFRGKLLDLTRPKVMGILNITPDSFYDGGLYTQPEEIKKRVNKMLREGADLIDIGACSSRPGAKDTSEEEEMRRLGSALEVIRKESADTLLSVDTVRSAVARRVIEDYEVNMINDISGGTLDPSMFETIAEMQVPYVVMHMQGTPGTMQDHPEYKHVVLDILRELTDRTNQLKAMGVNDILIDPGFGFGKTLEQNYSLLYRLEAFQMLELPILVGLSRKSMIYRLLESSPEDALNGTTALHILALERGANILRVHDVKEAVEAIQLYSKTVEEGEKI